MAEIIVKKGLEKDLAKAIAKGTVAEPIFTTDTEKFFVTNGNKVVEIGATDPDVMEHIKTLQTGKVDKVSGKGLSTNDYTTAEKNKLAGVATGANNYTHPANHPASMITEEANKKFMTDAERTKLAGLTSGAEVNQNAFSNVKVGTTTIAADSKTDVLELVAGTNVTLTPDATNDKITITSKDTVYTHPANHPASMITEETNKKFMTDAERTKLSGVATGANNYTHPSTHPASIIVQDANNRFMTDAERTKLSGLTSGAEVNQNAFSNVKVGSTTIAADSKTDVLELVAGTNVTLTADATNDKVTITSKDTVYTHPSTHPASIVTQDSTHRFVTDAEKTKWNNNPDMAYVDAKVAELVGSAPEALDTLKELSDALGNDANFAASVTTKLGTKVDKVSGKGLSTNDYTTAEKNKLAGIATGANNYVHPVNHSASIIAQDSNNRFVSDAEKSTWNAKASTAIVTTSANGLMSKEDKVKLNGIATGANNYVHPANHNDLYYTESEIDAKLNESSISGSTGATAGWYRVAQTTAVDTANALGTFKIIASASGKHSTTEVTAGLCYSSANYTLNQLSHSSYTASGITKVRLVQPIDHTDKKSYLEIYNPDAVIKKVTVWLNGLKCGWVLINPNTTGSIPSGYNSREITLVVGKIVANVKGDVDTVDGKHASDFVDKQTTSTQTIKSSITIGSVGDADTWRSFSVHRRTSDGIDRYMSMAVGALGHGSFEVHKNGEINTKINIMDGQLQIGTKLATNTMYHTGNKPSALDVGAIAQPIDISNSTVDVNTYNLANGAPDVQNYIQLTSGGAANITNIPVTGQPFILRVESIRWAGATDYITKQTFTSATTKSTYTRWCTSGTWSGWLPDTRMTAAPISGQVVVADGTAGGVKTTGFTIATSVPSGAKFTDTVYTHPTTAGNKHIPAAGAANQFLKYSAAGTAVWSALPTGTTGAAGMVQLNNATNSTSTTQAATANAVKLAYDRAEAAFQSASSGKTAIANAITAKGVAASGSDTHATLANKIGQISSMSSTARQTIFDKLISLFTQSSDKTKAWAVISYLYTIQVFNRADGVNDSSLPGKRYTMAPGCTLSVKADGADRVSYKVESGTASQLEVYRTRYNDNYGDAMEWFRNKSTANMTVLFWDSSTIYKGRVTGHIHNINIVIP